MKQWSRDCYVKINEGICKVLGCGHISKLMNGVRVIVVDTQPVFNLYDLIKEFKLNSYWVLYQEFRGKLNETVYKAPGFNEEHSFRSDHNLPLTYLSREDTILLVLQAGGDCMELDYTLNGKVKAIIDTCGIYVQPKLSKASADNLVTWLNQAILYQKSLVSRGVKNSEICALDKYGVAVNLSQVNTPNERVDYWTGKLTSLHKAVSAAVDWSMLNKFTQPMSLLDNRINTISTYNNLVEYLEN